MGVYGVVVILGVAALIPGLAFGSDCSMANRTSNPSACQVMIHTKMMDSTTFWFGNDYNTLCPNGALDGFTCTNPSPLKKSIGTRLFNTNPNFTAIDTYIDVKYTATPGEYSGCGHHVRVNQTWSMTLDPLSTDYAYPWYVKNTPNITWTAAANTNYTLIIYDVGNFYTHGAYVNIPGNDLSAADVLDPYHGPLASTNNVNVYVFVLYRQLSYVNASQEWITKIRTSNFTFSELQTAFNLSGPAGINWLQAKGDIYAAGIMRGLQLFNNCPIFVGQALDKKARPFLPNPAYLTVSLDMNFTVGQLTFTACCTAYSYQAKTFSPNPIGNPVYSTAETRSEADITFSFLKKDLMPQAKNFTGERHTLIAFDPDVPNPAAGTEARPLLHMLKINLVNGDPATGTVVQPYGGPTPPDTNPHYYYFLLYKHTSTVNAGNITSYAGQNCGVPNRCLWDINRMVSDYQMTLVGANYVRAVYDDYVIYRYIQRNNTDAYKDSICSGRQGYGNPCPASGSGVIMTSFVTSVLALSVSMVFVK